MTRTAPRLVVTGASRGIGRAIALEFARRGARIVICARRPAPLEEVSKEIQRAGGEAVPVVADVSTDHGARLLAIAVERNFEGELDVLINNAGHFRAVPMLETSLESDFHALLAANLTAVVLPTLRLLPSLLRSQRPHVLNILSVAALRGFPWNTGYGSAKWGARGFTEVLRAEFGDRMRVTGIFPGAVDTDAWVGAPFPHDRTKMLRPEQVAVAVAQAWEAESAPESVVLETPPGAVGG